MIILYITVGLIVGVLITRPFTTFFHEWGHALSYLIFTGKGSDIYIGSYGDKSKSFRVPAFGVNIWFSRNPFRWQYGLCDPHATSVSTTGIWVSALAGVIFSLIAAITFTWLAFAFDWHGFLKLIFIFAIGSAAFDILLNLRAFPILLKDGRILYSDGYILRNAFFWKRNLALYNKGIKLYKEKQFAQALDIFQSLLKKSFSNTATHLMIAHSYIGMKDQAQAEKVLKDTEREFGQTTDILAGFGWLYSNKNESDLAISYLEQALQHDPNNLNALNNLGYQLIKQKRYTEATPYFDKVIASQPDFAYAHNNRGHAKIESGALEDGIKDVEEALRLDDKNSYAYMNKGIYFLRKGHHEKAMELFLVARQLDPETDMLDEYILQANKM